VATLADIFGIRAKRRLKLLETCSRLVSTIPDYDTWNAGTYLALRLECQSAFCPVETRLPKIEKEITDQTQVF